MPRNEIDPRGRTQRMSLRVLKLNAAIEINRLPVSHCQRFVNSVALNSVDAQELEQVLAVDGFDAGRAPTKVA
jgi:hypothetical protein